MADALRRSRVVVEIYEVVNKVETAEPNISPAEMVQKVAEGLAHRAAVLKQAEAEPPGPEANLTNRQWRLRE